MSAPMSRVRQAIELRGAIVQMVIRFGLSQQKAAFAHKNGNAEEYERQQRAAARQFAAVQRLASALEAMAMAMGGAS